MVDVLLNLLYPEVCGICNTINKNSLCKKCELNIQKYEINKIVDCSRNKDVKYDYCINFLKYENLVRNKIIDYKFNDKSYLYKTFSRIILKNKKVYGFLKKYDIIIPVPLYKEKRNMRGYNQTELIAVELAKELKIEVQNNNLQKVLNTNTQSQLTKTRRLYNVKNAFKLKEKELIEEKRIIIFDDIYTTGSTLNECSRIIKQAGAKEILALTLAKD